ncbi:polysaccharide biosynthesis tyrosine autokinase [Nosocomiicoccus sp. HMSC09A07]|uniref:polysaccharide biosynthesis tyrosine autokinase n=1 Tax=Nosocomiicoccus sp. HMSC09A07 TaxID=1581145 RepID=UPI0008A5BA3F|nr:polysaccharide biosynthesis tyrosine autokinase [Nosocomiicoccus sp. HMSC09A07]OFS62171.1 capsular biosynthesis protein [Nosocomiicoccus sp. HMSC09A07]
MAKKKQKLNPLETYEHPKSVLSEKFRGIRTNITFSTAEGNIDSLVVAAERPDAGKSTITSNVAITYAQSGMKTLIIDGDMRKPTQHYLFQEPNARGLSTAIVEGEPIEHYVIPTRVNNLSLLTAGPIPPNPSELIASERFEKIFEELKNKYDMVIIDTPPILTVTDAQLFAKLTKNAVLVIDVSENNRNEVIRAKELIEKSGAKILGVILNKATLDQSTSSYYYYYGEE